MCCFTGRVETVSNTKIFVRARGERQVVVYEMSYAAPAELAMVLPIPVVPGSPENAVEFIDLSECPIFFFELSLAFPRGAEYEGLTITRDGEAGAKTLEVHDVGSYEASFVPRPEDFARLDERFRLPVPLWLTLRDYADWGFAVFKLKPTASVAPLHPIAFEFPRRDTDRLFFPTLHIHDGALDETAQFDHILYCQPQPAHQWHLDEWEEGREIVGRKVRCPEARLIESRDTCWRARLYGKRENRDTWLGKGAVLPASR